MRIWHRNNILDIVFSNKKNMLHNYPYIKKSNFLLPIAYINRFWDFSIACLKKEKSIKQSLNANQADDLSIKKRMELIKRLDMI